MSEVREPVTGDKPWSPKYTYVPALRVGNMVWLSGTTGTDDSGKIITAPGDIVEQTRQIFRKFEKLLNSIGGTCDDIVETHDFFTTTENYKGTAAVRREFFKTSYPDIDRRAGFRSAAPGCPDRDFGHGRAARRATMSSASGGYWEDFEVGQRYPTTSRTITEEDHLQFCKLVGYDVPLFLDEEYAKTTHFGGRICPSHLTMSFSTAMTGRLFTDTVLALVAVERGKFFGPVRPGDTIRTDVEVVEKKASIRFQSRHRGFPRPRHQPARGNRVSARQDRTAEATPGLIGARWTTSYDSRWRRSSGFRTRSCAPCSISAHAAIPYYRRVWAEARIDVAQIQTVADLERLPLTHKSALMADPESFRLNPAGLAPARTRIVGNHLHHGQHRRPDAGLQHDARLQRLPVPIAAGGGHLRHS